MPRLSDGRELCAYAIAHLAGFAFVTVASPWFYGTLRARNHHNLTLAGVAFAVVIGLGVLLGFLVLRRRLTEPTDDAGFAFGLALLAFIVVGLFYGLQPVDPLVPRPPPAVLSFAVINAAAAAIGTFAGGRAAVGWTGRHRDGARRAAYTALLTVAVAFPIAAVMAGGVEGAMIPDFGDNRAGHIALGMVAALIVGGVMFAVPCLLVTFLWCLLYFRMRRLPAGPIIGSGGRLTDGRDLCAYVLPHLALVGWGAVATPWIFSTLLAGHRDPRWPGLALTIVLALVVLAAFLHLRRGLARRPGEDRLGFALGLALLALIVLTAWQIWQSRHLAIQTPASSGGIGVFACAAVGTFVGAYAAIGWTRDQRDGLARALLITFVVALLAFPIAALLISGTLFVSSPTGVGNALGGFLMVLMVGAAVFVVPCLVVTFLWSLLYFRLVRVA
jgi:hypothetical protein